MPVSSTGQARGGIHYLEVMSTVDSGLRRNDEESFQDDIFVGRTVILLT